MKVEWRDGLDWNGMNIYQLFCGLVSSFFCFFVGRNWWCAIESISKLASSCTVGVMNFAFALGRGCFCTGPGSGLGTTLLTTSWSGSLTFLGK